MKLTIPPALIYGTSVIVVATAVYSVIGIHMTNNRLDELATANELLTTKLASTTADLNTAISNTHQTLSSALAQERQNVGTLQQQVGSYQQQVGSYSTTVENLRKLSKTDPQLLAKYSKVFFLNENYIPARLLEIPSSYVYSNTKQLMFLRDAMGHLQDMLSDAARDGIRIYVFSAYRSFDEQRALKGQYAVTYGAGTANTFSADQGYSEHQLGTTVDLITTGLQGELEGFEGTKAYTWLQANAYKYGFVLSYPANNKFYVFEPWHWRYVGVKLATHLHNQKIGFYDLDQRTIDEYLVNFFE